MDELYLQQIESGCQEVSMGDFSMLTLLGKGTYAKVVQVRCKLDNKVYAMKILKKKGQQLERMKTERKIFSRLDSQYIVKLKYSFQDNKRVFLVLEYCSGGELFSLLDKQGRLPESAARFYAAQLVLGLEYLHSQHIIYRDLKPENVMIDAEGYVKLTDFGLSKMNMSSQSDRAFSMVGTTEYLAPEVLFRQGHGKAVDWWTLGTILYEMVFGQSPFYSPDKYKVHENIKYSSLSFNWEGVEISSGLQDLLTGLLEKEPEKRLQGGAVKHH